MNKLQQFFSGKKSKLKERSGNVDLSAANNLFGTIARNFGAMGLPAGYNFLPTDGNGGTISLTGDDVNQNAKWLGLENKNMQFWAYNYCAPLAAVIDRLAEADANGVIDFVNESDGSSVINVNKNPKLLRIKRLMKKPNPMQTWEEFDSEQVVMCKIFGYCPVFCISPFGMDKSHTKYMFNLNPYYTEPTFNYEYSMFGGDGKESPIKLWRLSIFGKTYEIPSEDILLVKDGFVNSSSTSFALPISKIAGLDFFVSNICAAMEADNVLLKKKGPLGVFSGDAKPDIAGMTPMPPTEQDDLQDQLKRYGLTLGQLQYVVSKWPVKWNPMSFNLRDLMTKETIRSGIDGICDRLGYPAELMSGKNATYENRNSAEKYLYQNNIIPFSQRRMARYNEFFGLEEQLLCMDFDHLPVLQEDIMHAGQAFEALSKGLDLVWKSGLITFNQVLDRLEMDKIAGMDIYYPEWLRNNPEMNQNKKQNEQTKTESKA